MPAVNAWMILQHIWDDGLVSPDWLAWIIIILIAVSCFCIVCCKR